MKPSYGRYLRFILPFLVLGLFLAAAWLLHRELAGYHLHDIFEDLAAIPTISIVAALLLTALNYMILIGYDLMATRHLGQRLPVRKVAFASFLGYVSSNNFGALLGSTTVRYRLYSTWGLSSLDIVKLIGLLTLSFWLGLCSFAGIVFVAEPLSIPAKIPLPFTNVRPIGVLLLALVTIYLALGIFRREPLRIRGWEIRVPPLRLSVAQILISAADLAVAAGILYMLLPKSVVLSYPEFVAVYLLAIVTSVFSNVPGGLGVFELVIVVFSGAENPHVLLGSLLVFRLVYYLLPLAIGAILWTGYEALVHRQHVVRVAGGIRAIAPSVTHCLLPLVVFLAGAILLFSGALPADHGRLAWIRDILPLPVLEISHFLGSVLGVCLLLLARGLQRRLDSAYWLTMAMLALGAVFSLLKGFDYEEATILVVMIAIMLPARHCFHRKGSLFRQPLNSIDLMRYTSDAPSGVMEYLFTQLILWGREQGYQWFNLGMAPLSGFEGHNLAPLWSRFGNLVFRHGEHFYNFQGLRQYKEKFQPQWRPRYLASPGGLSLPFVLKDISAIISGGLVGLVRK